MCSRINFCIIRGKPERAPNTRETRSGVYIIFVRDLAWQRLNAHAQTPHGRLPTVTSSGRHQTRLLNIQAR